MDIIKNLTKSISLLDEIEEEYETIPKIQSELDLRLSDVYHFIEHNHLNTSQRYRIVSLLRDLLEERRKNKTDWELLRTFKNIENKLSQKDNRKMLIAEIRKKEKLINSDYKYRVYTEEELRKFIGK
ncbi:MAG: hypothetical protein HFJ12_01505 [Bacilli bacterium]|nr:hypothetical protein [Bacilli bacterium]